MKKISTLFLALGAILTTHNAWAQAAAAKENTDFTVSTTDILVGCALMLLIVVFVLGYTLRSSVLFYHDKRKRESAAQKIVPALLLFFAALYGGAVHAQEPAAADAVQDVVTDAYLIRWVLYFVIAVELVLIWLFAKWIKFFTGVEAFEKAKTAARANRFSFAKFWAKINNFRPIEEEAGIDTGHEYDGIRELNNVTPPWFIVGFALSILFAGVYMWRYHVAYSAPSQIEEYTLAVALAKQEQAAFLKSQANNVDETNVKLLDADGIAAGAALFAANCVACHGDKGQGAVVGPNLCDNYWLHNGGISDIFKTIKYGWQEKGMKSWKDDFSPNQIAQLASYVYSLRGSNPPGAKEPQGTLYAESGAAAGKADSAAVN